MPRKTSKKGGDFFGDFWDGIKQGADAVGHVAQTAIPIATQLAPLLMGMGMHIHRIEKHLGLPHHFRKEDFAALGHPHKRGGDFWDDLAGVAESALPVVEAAAPLLGAGKRRKGRGFETAGSYDVAGDLPQFGSSYQIAGDDVVGGKGRKGRKGRGFETAGSYDVAGDLPTAFGSSYQIAGDDVVGGRGRVARKPAAKRSAQKKISLADLFPSR